MNDEEIKKISEQVSILEHDLDELIDSWKGRMPPGVFCGVVIQEMTQFLLQCRKDKSNHFSTINLIIDSVMNGWGAHVGICKDCGAHAEECEDE